MLLPVYAHSRTNTAHSPSAGLLFTPTRREAEFTQQLYDTALGSRCTTDIDRKNTYFHNQATLEVARTQYQIGDQEHTRAFLNTVTGGLALQLTEAVTGFVDATPHLTVGLAAFNASPASIHPTSRRLVLAGIGIAGSLALEALLPPGTPFYVRTLALFALRNALDPDRPIAWGAALGTTLGGAGSATLRTMLAVYNGVTPSPTLALDFFNNLSHTIFGTAISGSGWI